MAHIKHDFVLWGSQHTVQGHRQLHRAKVGGKMAARLGNILQQKLADLRAQLFHLLLIQLL